MKIHSEPFLWIHLGGIIVFPLLWGVTLIGIGVGNRYSYWLEIPLLIVIAVLPVLLMQLYRPFNIFSVLFFALKPQSLTANQRKILALFKRKQQKVVNALATGLILVNLWLLYYFAPGTAALANLLPQQRILGLAIACGAFFGSNLFFQIPLSAFQVLLTNELEFAQTQQCSPEEIESDFTTAGIRVSKIPWLTSSLQETEEKNKLC